MDLPHFLWIWKPNGSKYSWAVYICPASPSDSLHFTFSIHELNKSGVRSLMDAGFTVPVKCVTYGERVGDASCGQVIVLNW